MIATMDDLKYKEHKLAEKAQRIKELRNELHTCKIKEAKLKKNKPTCNKKELSYEESLEFGERLDEYKEKLEEIELNKLKLERQLSALQLQTCKLLPVSGVNVKVKKYSEDGEPLQTYCIRREEKKEQKDNNYIEIEEYRQ